MLATRELNQWLGTSYTLEEVARMDPLLFDIYAAVRQGIPTAPKPKGPKKIGRS
jgi:hypothetical protein